MSKNIWANSRFLVQKLTGMQRFAYNILLRLPQVRLISPGIPLQEYSSLPSSQVLVLSHRLKSHLWDQLVLPSVLNKDDVLWSPTGMGPLFFDQHILTIPDLSFLEYPKWFEKKYVLWYKSLLPIAAKHAQKIITISNFSKSKIMELLNISEEKIVVTYVGVDQIFQPLNKTSSLIKDFGLKYPYILSVGAITPRKNLTRLFKAWEIVSQKRKDIWLVFVGEAGLASSNMSSIGSLPPRVIHLNRVNDEQLVQLYVDSLCYLHPSLYEGFGLPVLEAMACGTPVITSNITSMPEIAGDAAILIDPYDIESIVEGVIQVIDNEDLRKNLRGKGLNRSKKFTWENSAQLTWEVLQQVAMSD